MAYYFIYSHYSTINNTVLHSALVCVLKGSFLAGVWRAQPALRPALREDFISNYIYLKLSINSGG